jgi:hypothetical protein
VAVIHVATWRGHAIANAQRFGESTPSIRTSARIADLSPADLGAFCDWEACVSENGYGHTCWVNDAGWERCRVCQDEPDCNGNPISRDSCIAHAGDPGRATCHVGLLQECALQRSLRGLADTRTTHTCALSAQACAGAAPGDLSEAALAAQHETDQVTVEEYGLEVAVQQRLLPDSGIEQWWQMTLATQWDGGLPQDDLDSSVQDASDGQPGE